MGRFNTNYHLTGLLLAVSALCGSSLFAQSLQVTGANTPPFTPNNLISNIFLGQGVEVTNITYNGDPIAVGYFTGGESVIGIERGIVMTTGRASGNAGTPGSNGVGSAFANNSNNGGTVEPDLDNLSALPLNDVAVYSITFIPTSDTLRFNYCFGSEEYPEYGCSDFNDIFGFFIQGPGFTAPTNIASIPNTWLPVSINNIHPTNPGNPNCGPVNIQYYNANTNTNNQPVYDGFTDVFTAQAVVIPCQPYTIKLAIADVSDAAFDSGVFLEAKSFGTGSIRTELATVSGDGTVTEGCAQATLRFSIPNELEQNLPLDYNIWGSATNGTDYQAISTTLAIPAGQTQIEIPIVGFEDNISEGTEFLAIDIQKNPCTRDTIYVFFRENTLVVPQLRTDTTICTGGQPLELNGTLPIPVPQPSVFTNTTDYTINSNISVFAPINVFGVQPTTLSPDLLRSVCFNIDHNWVDDLDIYLISPGGQFLELTTDNGQDGNNYTNTCFSPSSTLPLYNPPLVFAPSTSAPFTNTYQPEGVWEDLWDGTYPTNGNWVLQINDDSNGFNGTLRDWTITFEPSYKVNYIWSPAAGLDCVTCPIVNANPTQSTLYQVIASDSYGCTVTDSVMLDVKPALAQPQIECSASSTNSVSFEWDTIAGTTGYEIRINGGPWFAPQNDTSHTVNNLPPLTNVVIEVRGIDPQPLCAANIGTQSCINCASPGVTTTITPVNCFGATNGIVEFLPDNLNPPYQFRLGVLTNATGVFTGLPAGNYVGQITDGTGCDTTINVTVGSPTQIMGTLSTIQAVQCQGESNGAMTVIATGGAGSYSYFWNASGTQLDNTMSDLSAGVYTVTIRDADNCSRTVSGTLTEPTLLTTNATAVAAKCNGTPTGSLSATAFGGTMPYNYAWNGLGGSAPNAVLAGTYTVTTTDGNGCTATSTAVVTQPNALGLTVTNTAATCSNTNNGIAIAISTGGIVPYTYKWSDPNNQFTATAQNLLPGLYTVTITDAQLCTITATTSIVAPPPLEVSMTQTPADCNGTATGTAIATPQGGNGVYNYLWSAGNQTTATAANLVVGLYTVTITDNKGCTTTGTINVTEPENLLLFGTQVPATCFGYTDGAAKVTVSGGNEPYSYLWSNGEQDLNIEAVTGGFYTVTVTDQKSCTGTLVIQVLQPSEIVPAITSTPVLCYGGESGTISSTVVGGSGSGYEYTWFGPQNFIGDEAQLDSLQSGDYYLTITDGAGCSTLRTIFIDQPDAPLQLTAPLISDTVCFETFEGRARVEVTGGTTPYTFIWDDSTAQVTQYAENLRTGLYRVTVTDANGCYRIDSTYILQKGPLFIYVVPNPPLCYNGTNGYASVEFVSYGADPYDPSLIDFTWNTVPPQYGRSAIGLSANTTYTVSAVDEDGCVSSQVAPIGNQEELFPAIENITPARCNGEGSGGAIAIGNGGTAPYTFLWSPNAPNRSDSLQTTLLAGEYRITLTDANGCQGISTVTITEPPAIEATAAITPVRCAGESSGLVLLTADGGVGNLSYAWSNGANAKRVDQLAAGTYTVSITDENDCLLEQTLEVGQPTPLTATATVNDASCFSARDGSIAIEATGGVPPYRYTLNNQVWNGSPLQIGLSADTYTARVIDGNNCEWSQPDLVLNQRSTVVVDLGPDITIELGESTDLLANIEGAADPYIVAWRTEDSLWLSCLDCPDPSVDSLKFENIFELVVTDDLGCTGEDEIRITVEKPRRIFVPTGFTPNGDNNNDVLMVHGQMSAKILSFRVFDRWGEMLWHSGQFIPNDASMGWNGQFRGQLSPPDTYIWTIEVEYADGVQEVLHGQSMLIR
jgi:gliding motility-associated-like protein